MKEEKLTLLGFSEKEGDVYFLLVSRGPLTIAEITSHTSLHRPYAYKTVTSLIEKQAVYKSIEKGRKVYIATSPRKVKDLLEIKKQKAEALLDELEDQYVAPHLETKVTTFHGRKGITSMFADLVESQKKGDIFYRYTSEENTQEADTFLPKDYRTIRDKKELERFVIANSQAALSKKKRLERAMKVIPKGEASFSQNCIQLIYGNKVSFMNLTKLQGVIIEDGDLASFQREIFKMLYKRI